jgi:hypothetical protein
MFLVYDYLLLLLHIFVGRIPRSTVPLYLYLEVLNGLVPVDDDLLLLLHILLKGSLALLSLYIPTWRFSMVLSLWMMISFCCCISCMDDPSLSSSNMLLRLITSLLTTHTVIEIEIIKAKQSIFAWIKTFFKGYKWISEIVKLRRAVRRSM